MSRPASTAPVVSEDAGMSRCSGSPVDGSSRTPSSSVSAYPASSSSAFAAAGS